MARRERCGGRCGIRCAAGQGGSVVGGGREPGPGGVGAARRGGHPHRIPWLPRAQRPPRAPLVVGAFSGRPEQRQRARRQRQRTLFGCGVISAPLRSALAAAGLDPGGVAAVIDTALAEDLRDGPDVTTTATVPAEQSSVAAITPRQPGVLAGGPVALAVFEMVGAGFGGVSGEILVPDGEILVPDGGTLVPGEAALLVRGRTAALLTAERTALNLLTHLSGIATAARAWVDAVAMPDRWVSRFS